jgi:hypothetical protein
MATRRLIACFLATLGMVAVGCGGKVADLATISAAGDLVLYEGLPHPFFEPTSLAKEKASRPTRDLAGYPFYLEPLALKAEDAASLRALLADRGTTAPFSAEKKCGGFHPDYAIAWTSGQIPTQALICLGCQEVLVSGREGQARYDLRQEAYKRLKSLLEPYVKNRPPLRPEN